MLRFSTWKFLAIVAMTLAAILVVAPSMLSPSNYQALAARLPSWLTPPTIVLGLDLQGGSHVMLEVDQADLLSTQIKNLRDDVRRILREEKVAITGGIGATARGVQVRVAEEADREKVLPKFRLLRNSRNNGKRYIT
jgi:preprotein translocase subunit SecD